jgi:hypothetical protein
VCALQIISPLLVDMQKEFVTWTLMLSMHQSLLFEDLAYVALVHWETFEVCGGVCCSCWRRARHRVVCAAACRSWATLCPSPSSAAS